MGKGDKVGRPKKAKYDNRNKMKWTDKELQYLDDNWGTISVDGIAKTLGRTTGAVIDKAYKIGLEKITGAIDGVILNQFLKAIKTNLDVFNNWVSKYGFPVRQCAPIKQKYRYVDIDEFWKWAKKYHNLINFVRFEEGALGKEPNWVESARATQKKSTLSNNMCSRKWTEFDEKKLISLLKTYKYTYTDLADYFNRTEGAIKQKIRDLGTLYRPILPESKVWTEDEVYLLIKMKEEKLPYDIISRRLGRSSRAIQCKYKEIKSGKNMKDGKYINCTGSWSKEDEKFLMDNYLNMTYKKIGEALNRTVRAVEKRAELLGLSKPNGKKWTDEEVKFLEDNYMTMTSREIAKSLNRTATSVEKKLAALKMRKINIQGNIAS